MLIEVFLILLLYVLFLSTNFRGIARLFANLRFNVATLTLNFVFTLVVS